MPSTQAQTLPLSLRLQIAKLHFSTVAELALQRRVIDPTNQPPSLTSHLLVIPKKTVLDTQEEAEVCSLERQSRDP